MFDMFQARRVIATLTAVVVATVGLAAVGASPASAVSICAGTPTTSWTGAVSSDWTVAGNWTAGVPTSASNVCVLADQANDPVINPSVTAAVNTIEVQIGGTLTINQGQFNITGASSIATLTLSGVGVGLMTNGALTVDTAFNMNRGAITGSGSLTTVIGANLATSNIKNIDVPFTNLGTLVWSDGDLNFGSKTVTNNGEWRAQGTADTLTAGSFNNSGSFVKANAGTETITANYVNSGTTNVTGGILEVAQANSFTINGGFVNVTGANLNRGTGTVQIVSGWLSPGSGGTVTTSTVNVVSGVLNGTGTVVGNVVASSGEVRPGGISKASIGTLTINGNFTQSGATFVVDVSNPSTEDLLAVSGTFTISSGDLKVDGYAAGNTTYDVATYASISGSYGNIIDELPNNPAGYFVADYGTSPLTLTALYQGVISGYAFVDANGNQVKDGGENTGLSGVQVWLDLDNDGVYDGGEPLDSTDGNGFYDISGINPATYNVQFGTTPGYARSTALPLNRVVGSGQSLTANAGYFLSSTVSGSVFNDIDLSGTSSGGDTAASGINIFMDTNNDGIRQGGETQVATNGSGNYAFTGVAPGTYKLRVNLPAGGRLTTGNPADTVVTSGNDATGINFGIDAFTGSVLGTVFIDSDSDGVRDAGETAGLPNETVYIDTDRDGNRDAGERTDLTDANGAYEFLAVVPGNFDVRLSTVPGYAPSTPALTNITLGNNQDITGQLIGVYEAPSISGLLYSDLDGDGTRDAGEPGIGGVNVFIDLDADGVLDTGETRVPTDVTGVYVFPAVAAGTYSVRVSLLGTSTVTTANSPTSVTITSGTGRANLNFGINATGTISGVVFIDANGNGVKDTGEANAPDGTAVFADLDADGVRDTGELQVTTVAGAYSFTGVRANVYDIDVVLPLGFTQTSVELGTVYVGMDTLTNTGTGIGLFDLANVTGAVYRDTNENGARDAGEPGLANITVYLDANVSNAFDNGEVTTLTDVNGNYVFTDLGPGPHNPRVTLPAGATRTTTNPAAVSLTSGTNGAAALIGLDVLGSISGQLYVDANGNGTKDAGENSGVAATVFIDANHNGALDSGEPTTTSAANGTYSLFFLNPGTYDVDVVTPVNSIQTTAELDAVTLTLNQNATGGDVGLFTYGSVSGRVFFDANKNAADNGEAGVLKATVFIDENRNGRLDAGEQAALTGNDGSYVITGVGPGAKAIRAQAWGTAVQTTPNPADANLQSGTVVSGKSFGFDQGVVGSGDPQTQGTGYWMIGGDGRVYNFGAAVDYGSIDAPSSPAVGLAPTVTGNGYWAATANGGVFTYGDARYYGSAARINLNAPILSVVATPTGGGYWLLASDGGVFTYGDAAFYGSTGSMKLNKPVVGMTPTPSGRGYWLVASDGGVFTFGDAAFYGSMGGKPLNKPVVGIAATADGTGYWMVASDGGMFTFGSAPFLGTAGEVQPLNAPIVGIRARGDGQGYWEVGADGGVFTYGKAPFYGVPGRNLSSPIVK